MCSDVIIIVSIGPKDPAQMRFTQDDKVVHTLAPDRSDQPFGEAILPRRRRCNRLVPDAHGTQSAGNAVAIDAIAIPQQIFRRLIPCVSPCRSAGALPVDATSTANSSETQDDANAPVSRVE